jgi:hypothetical protein
VGAAKSVLVLRIPKVAFAKGAKAISAVLKETRHQNELLGSQWFSGSSRNNYDGATFAGGCKRQPIPVIPDEWTPSTTGAIEAKDRNLTFLSQSSQHCSLSISV